MQIHSIPSIEAVVITELLQQPKSKPTNPQPKDTNSKPWHLWGDRNDYPQEIYKKCKDNSIIPSTINWKSRALRSGGVRYGIITGYKDGAEIFEPITHAEIEEFLERNDIDLYLEEGLSDLIWFSHQFAEMGLVPDRSKIASLYVQEASFCRLEKQDKKTGEIKNVFIDGNWDGIPANPPEKVEMVDVYWDPVKNLRNKSKASKVIYPVSIASPGKVYYQIPDWHSIVNGDWLDVAMQIPKFKSYLMKNQMSLKYVIHIPESWWEWKYPGFSTSGKYDDAKRKEIMKKEINRFNSLLSGVENTGKGLFMTFKADSSGKDYTKWEIKTLDTAAKSGDYMEESQEASSHILYALGVDGTLIGSTPGKSLGAGSGSDKRVAWNIFIINNKPLQDKVLKPLDFITKYNGWKGPKGEKIVWRFNNYLIATLDTGSSIQNQSEKK